MKHEDKELLLRDLCARLPYGVKCQIKGEEDFKPLKLKSFIQGEGFCAFDFDIKENLSLSFKELDEFKPYLFPLKTMTIEQRNEFYEMTQPYIIASFEEGKLIGEEGEYRPVTPIMMYPNMIEIDWLLKRHFDVFGLIEKGLAIDATNLNIY